MAFLFSHSHCFCIILVHHHFPPPCRAIHSLTYTCTCIHHSLLRIALSLLLLVSRHASMVCRRLRCYTLLFLLFSDSVWRAYANSRLSSFANRCVASALCRLRCDVFDGNSNSSSQYHRHAISIESTRSNPLNFRHSVFPQHDVGLLQTNQPNTLILLESITSTPCVLFTSSLYLIFDI